MIGKLHNLSKEQLYSFIEDKKSGLAAHYEDVCEAIWELETRCKDKHPMRDHLYCRFYKLVHNKTLSVRMIQALAGGQRLLAHMEGRPINLQDELADGRLISVCRIVKGGIIEARIPINEFSQKDLQVAFPIGKPPATLIEQRAHLEAKLAAISTPGAPKPPIISADALRRVVIIDGKPADPEALAEAMRAIGYNVTRDTAFVLQEARRVSEDVVTQRHASL